METAFRFVERNSSNNKIIAIGGGKGGVGKSLVSSSLAISLGKLGKSVTLIDLDLGSANLHTCLGIKIPPYSLSDFLVGRVQQFQDLVAPTPLSKMTFISGFHDSLDIADIESVQLNRVLIEIRKLPSDFVVLDLGAGTNNKTLDLFLAAHHKILTVIPEPTSVENAYRFVKSAFYRQLKKLETETTAQKIISEAMDHKNKLGIKSPADLVRYIQVHHPSLGQKFVNEIKAFQIDVLMNQTRSYEDKELGKSIASVCQKYFGVTAHSIGHLDYDNNAWQALRRKRPLIIEHPNSPIVPQISSIARSLMNEQFLKAVV